MSPKAIATASFNALFVDFDAAAVADTLAPGYIQHNPAVPTGADPIIGFVPALKNSGIKPTTHRVIAEDDLVVLHNTYENATLFGGDTLIAFDVYRVQDGKVAEHWDNLSPLAPPNPSGRTQTDGTTEVTDLDRTAQNKALVTGFVEAVLMQGDTDRIAEFLSPDTYLQHNSAIADGLDGLGAALQALAAQGVTMAYTKLHLAVAEGNFVFTASEGTFADEHTAFFDLFRVHDGRIVEHWDVLAPIPAEMAHDNGKF